MTPTFIKPLKIIGNNLVFRNAKIDDAEFILGLRTNEIKSRYLSSTSSDIEKQRLWLSNYSNDSNQIYFIIENIHGESVGTVRLYDQQNDSFCWGSWIKKDGAPSGFGVESAMIIYHFALHLGFKAAHFDVRKKNVSVCQFHERFGATVVTESEDDFFFNITKASIIDSLKRYEKYLPNGIQISF
ncbi:GNAT family N-acetyltransferase [Undibacterium sp.]|uniref:GNAT family N-acetyltransferase n=1 Tax=Undibacterium sp. TaxID=1914977 RepID=UPI0025D4E9E7|nr:GNAT family N-acetyltransferase [Undibacterium sp.]